VHPTSVLDGLDAEWRLLVHSPRGGASLARWGRRQPLLGRLNDLAEVLEVLSGEERRLVLQTLVEVACFDDLAARVLLQAILPGVIRLAGEIGDGDPDAVVELLGYAWELIRTYPPERSGSVAGNVLLDARKRYHRGRRRETPAPVDCPTRQQPVEDAAISRVMLTQILRASRLGVITQPALELIWRTRVDDEDLTAIAAETGESLHCVTIRRTRAERRLRTHLELTS
jgi:hypothetical protein